MYVYQEHDQRLLEERVAQYRDQTRRYLAGELSEDEFLALRLQNGLYIQRYAPMLRISVPYGLLASRQLRRLAHIVRTYDKGFCHVSTRQNIQLNWPSVEEVPDILAELAEVMAELEEQRAHSLEIVAEQEDELSGLMRDSGDGAGQDQADLGATTFERDHEMSVLNNEREKLAQIDRALARIEDGTYGVCESCGQPIGKLRLMAFPRATLCMTCKQREERR